MNRLLLMTSTIAPAPGVHALARSDPAERLGDYRRALDFYLDRLQAGDVDAIVYVDNSGHDLSTLRAQVAQRGLQSGVEFISYRSPLPPGHNRLFLEAHLVEYFLAHSRVLRASPGATVWKVTGRYIVRNLAHLVRRCESQGDHDLYVNLRDHPYAIVDFYLVGFKVEAYRRLVTRNLPAFEGPEDGERRLRQIIDGLAPGELALSTRFPVVPRLSGVRGWDGRPYGRGRDTLKYLARSVALRLCPGLKI